MKNDQDGVPAKGEDGRDLRDVPDFGVWNLSIKEAAELVAVDMWISGMIEGVNEPEDFDWDYRAPWLIAALADTIAAFEARLAAAVDSGKLEASFVRLGPDEQVIPEKAHICCSDLVEWLQERGLGPGEVINEWILAESDIADLLCDEVAFLRAARRSGLNEFDRIEREQPGQVRAALRVKDVEILRLKEELALCQTGRPAKVDRPLHTRQRRTLLTILAALCDAAGIDYRERGAAQRIKSKTELLGAPIDDGTIIKLLNEIPDALETRMK